MALEIYVYAPNAEKDRERITKMLEGNFYKVLDMQLQAFPESGETYFKATVEQSDTFIQD
jgi:hypothetical protein